MKIKDGFILRKVGTQYVAAATGKASENFNGIIRLNESGAFVFRQLQEGATAEELAARLLEEYDVDEAAARQNVDHFLAALKEADALV